MFNAGNAVWDFEKSPRPNSFCSLKQKGQWSVETTLRSSVRSPATDRRGDVPRGAVANRRTSRPRILHARGQPRQKQILRTRFGKDVLSTVARRNHFVEGFRGREVHDVERSARDASELYRPVRRFTFQERGAGRAVKARIPSPRARDWRPGCQWRFHFPRAS